MLSTFAQASTDGTAAGGTAAGGILGFMAVIWILALVNFIIFILDLVHLIKHDDIKDRMLWIIVVLLVPFGALVYFFGPRRTYNRLHKDGAVTPAAQPSNPAAVAPAPVEPTTTEPAPSVPPVTDQPPAESTQPVEPAPQSEPTAYSEPAASSEPTEEEQTPPSTTPPTNPIS